MGRLSITSLSLRVLRRHQWASPQPDVRRAALARADRTHPGGRIEEAARVRVTMLAKDGVMGPFFPLLLLALLRPCDVSTLEVPFTQVPVDSHTQHAQGICGETRQRFIKHRCGL